MLLATEGVIAATDQRARCPEALGIKTLSQFASVEEAIKALAPRSLPTPEQVGLLHHSRVSEWSVTRTAPAVIHYRCFDCKS
jgi:hypothetical protein